MRRVDLWLLAPGLPLLVGAGAFRQCLAQQANAPIAIQLTDSISFENELQSGYLYRVTVRQGTKATRIPRVLAKSKPVLVGDSVIVGVTFDTAGFAAGLFEYSLLRRVATILPPPSDYQEALTTLSIAPDGRHLAYVRFPGDETGVGVVREWRGGVAVFETPAIRVDPSDALTGGAKWVDRDVVEMAIAPEGSKGKWWIRFRVDLSSKSIVEDTLRTP